MNDKNYTIIVCQDGSHAMFCNTRTDEDLIEKYLQRREDKFSYLQWNKGIIPMRHVLGVMIN